MPQTPLSPRKLYRLEESRRILASVSLATKFPRLKSLKVDLQYLNAEGLRGSQIKYTVNLDNAKSAFCFECSNKECVRGDFDLSEILAKAITGRNQTAEGELRCHGWRDKDSIKKTYCRNILRYKLALSF